MSDSTPVGRIASALVGAGYVRLPDLLVVITDTCHACATGEVQIAYQVCNQGDVDVDVIVFATGFDAMTGALRRIDIKGRDGVTLRDVAQSVALSQPTQLPSTQNGVVLS